MKTLTSYIAGQWLAPRGGQETADAINPATEEVVARICFGAGAEVDAAVKAARAAFASYGQTLLEERSASLRRLISVFERRSEEMGWKRAVDERDQGTFDWTTNQPIKQNR